MNVNKENTEVIEKIELSVQSEVIENNEGIETSEDKFKLEKIELSANINNLTSQFSQLQLSYDNIKKEIDLKDLKIVELQSVINNYNAEKLNNLVENAILEGKITRESKQDFIELSYEKAESILNKLSAQTKSLSETILLSKKTDHKTYDWYLNNDQAGLIKLSKENPSLYKQLETDSLKLK